MRNQRKWIWPENFYTSSTQYIKNKWTDVEYPTFFLFNIKQGTFRLNFAKQSVAMDSIGFANDTGTALFIFSVLQGGPISPNFVEILILNYLVGVKNDVIFKIKFPKFTFFILFYCVWRSS